MVGDDDTCGSRCPASSRRTRRSTPRRAARSSKGKRDLDAAKKLLAESGYTGQPVTCVVAQDQPITKAQGDVTADLLKQLGMNVDFVATDWGTVGARRAMKTPPGQGGWNMFHTWHAGADCINPARLHRASAPMATRPGSAGRTARTSRRRSRPGSTPRTSRRRRPRSRQLNKAALEDVVYAPTGFFLSYQAWRKNVSGVVKGPLPFFWDVTKTA